MNSLNKSMEDYLLDMDSLKGYSLKENQAIIKRWINEKGAEIYIRRIRRGENVKISLKGFNPVEKRLYNVEENLGAFRENLKAYKTGQSARGLLKAMLDLGDGALGKQVDNFRTVLKGFKTNFDLDEKREMEFSEIYDQSGKPAGLVRDDSIVVKDKELSRKLDKDHAFDKEENTESYAVFEYVTLEKITSGLGDLLDEE